MADFPEENLAAHKGSRDRPATRRNVVSRDASQYNHVTPARPYPSWRPHLSTGLARILSSIVILGGLALAACGPSAPGSPRGDAAAVQQRGGTDAGNRTVNPTRDRGATRTLDANEIGLVYALLFQEYVDPVDGAAVVGGAGRSISDLMRKSGFLPIDMSIMDLMPATPGEEPARSWSGFASTYEALID